MPSSLVPIRGHPLFIETHGTSGPLFISLHGLGGSTNLFPLASALSSPESGKGFRVVRFDFEGAGKSPLAPASGGETKELTVEGFVEDVKSVLEFAGWKEGEKVVLFGHSLGAAVGLHFAATYPSLLSHLILSCPGVSRAGNPEAVKITLGLAEMARSKGPANMADFAAIKNTSPTSSLLARTLVRTALQESSPEGYAKTCEMIARTPSADWEKISVRTMIIAGQEDQISSVGQAQKIKACMVKAESVEVVPVDAGHQPAVECPEKVLELLQTFLA
ncbi:hypothetical protein JCM8547_003264 [Rhodosporidiobolus lusitaniae]